MFAANEIPREELLLRDVGIQFWELRRIRKENDLLNESKKNGLPSRKKNKITKTK